MVGRPKSNTPNKKKLTLTVSDYVRNLMTLVSEERGVSISALVEEWAIKEAGKLNEAGSLDSIGVVSGPKTRSNVTKTKNTSLTVSDSTRELLAILSDAHKMSITFLVEEWVQEEARILGLID